MPDFCGYNRSPIGPVTLIYKNDYFTGTSTKKTWDLINKTALHLGNTVQSRNTFWTRSIPNSLLVDNLLNQFTTSTAADVGAMVIAPGSQNLPIKAYDRDNVPGDPTPRVKQYPFYVGPDSAQSIQTFIYTQLQVKFVDKDPLYGADLSWLTIAPALVDGTPGAYQPSGTPLSLPDLSGFATVVNQQAHVPGADHDILEIAPITDPLNPGIRAGVFFVIDPGTVLEEQVKCLAVNGNLLTTLPFGQAHLPGAQVFEYYHKCWVQTHIPDGASGGTPINLNDLALALESIMESRI